MWRLAGVARDIGGKRLRGEGALLGLGVGLLLGGLLFAVGGLEMEMLVEEVTFAEVECSGAGAKSEA